MIISSSLLTNVIFLKMDSYCIQMTFAVRGCSLFLLKIAMHVCFRDAPTKYNATNHVTLYQRIETDNDSQRLIRVIVWIPFYAFPFCLVRHEFLSASLTDDRKSSSSEI